ncbi:hypothetical protein BC835DRAFT_1308903 [Cytidiella melzeri]|nr:hypothetical protein BC835DRAFT_1308903 [Cytidiella melzeri]
MPLFKSNNPPPPPPPQSSPPSRSRSMFSRKHNNSDPYHNDSSYDEDTNGNSRRGLFSRRRSSSSSGSRSRGGGLKNEPSIVHARQKVADAENSEREADRALGAARAAVREARQHVQMLEREALEDARRAKAKQAEAKTGYGNAHDGRINSGHAFGATMWRCTRPLSDKFPGRAAQAKHNGRLNECIEMTQAQMTQLANAVIVYLHPAPAVVPAQLSATRANLAISRHLNLERFERFGDGEESWDDSLLYNGQGLVGTGARDGLLITMSEEEANGILPHILKPTFELPSPPVDSLTPLVRGYTHRAAQVYPNVASDSSPISSPRASLLLDIFSAPTEANQVFLTSASALADFLDTLPSSHLFQPNAPENFGAFELSGLKGLAEQYGPDSENYKMAREVVKSIFESALARDSSSLHLVLVTYPSSEAMYKKRQHDQPQSPLPMPHPAEPIGSVSTCFESVDVCGNATESCSGHGECLAATKAGRTCFVCACAASRNDQGQKEEWAGTACERKDISGPFVLLGGTTVVLILLVGGSIALLSAVGSAALPSTLTGGVVGTKRE